MLQAGSESGWLKFTGSGFSPLLSVRLLYSWGCRLQRGIIQFGGLNLISFSFELVHCSVLTTHRKMHSGAYARCVGGGGKVPLSMLNLMKKRRGTWDKRDETTEALHSAYI